MNREVFKKKAAKIYEEAQAVLVAKNLDYAPKKDALANFRSGGLRSVVYRVAEKSVRLRTITDKKNPNYESARDTLLDNLNYCVIGILMLDLKKPSSPRRRS